MARKKRKRKGKERKKRESGENGLILIESKEIK